MTRQASAVAPTSGDVSAGAPVEGAAVRVAVLGAGNVGGALVRILARDGAAIRERTGVDLEVVGIAVSDAGQARDGIDGALVTTDAAALVADPAVEIVVELIGGIEPARRLVESALRAGKPVVTANKALLAADGRRLAELAAEHGVDLLYEGAVAGAIPLIRPLRESLAGERIERVMGIVNGTTNFILTQMTEEGSDYDDALAEAQALGLAERDPGADVDGHDAAAKAAILAGLAFGCDVAGDDVHREGISNVRAVDVAFAGRLGYVVKLLAVVERGEEGVPPPGTTAGEAERPSISVRVHPAMVPRDHPLAAVRGAFNAVFIEGAAAGELMFYGRGAGGMPTASAVLGDLIDAAHHLRAGTAARAPRWTTARIRPLDDLRTAYYINIDVLDRPGVLGAVATLFGEHGVSIRSMEQVGMGDEARLIFLTHVAREGDLQQTLTELAALPAVEQVGGVLRVVGGDPDVPATEGRQR